MWPGAPEILVGRDAELERLVERLAVARSGSATIAVIEGDAGIGKSALVGGFADLASAQGVQILRGAAHPLERTRPFGPIVDALQLHGFEHDRRRSAIARLLAGEIAPDLAPLGAGQLLIRVVEEVIDLLESTSCHTPVLLAIDDLHWAESATLLTLEWVLRRLHAAPLMLVLASRPAPRSPDLSRLLQDASRSGATVIRLDRLSDDDVEALARAELGAPLGSSLRQAVMRAGGSPLWVVELLRSLAADGRIDRSSGVAELRSGDLPESVAELVLHRLSELPDRSVNALRSASLLGESFSLLDMAAVTGRRVSDLVDDLGPAFTAGLVADHRGVLAFRHQLVRDAIYESLPPAVRAALHREAAERLAAVGSPPEKVAGHLMLGALTPNASASRALRDAAIALAPRAPGVAAELLRRAAELLPEEGSERDGMLLALAECAQRAGDVPGSIDIAESVLARPHDESISIPLRFVVISGLSIQRRGADLIPQTEALLADPRASAADRAHALGLSANSRIFSGDPAGGESAARRGLGIAQDTGERSMMSWNLTMLGVALISQGRYAEAIESTARATKIATDHRDLQARRRVPHMTHGLALSQADRFQEAETAFRTATEEATAVGSWMLEADIQLLAAEVRLLRGDWERAVAEIEGGIEFARERNNRVTLPRFIGHLAVVHGTRGDLAAGEALLMPLAGELHADEPCFGAEFLFHAAALLAEVAGQPAVALDHLHRFLSSAAERHNLNGHRFISPAMTRLALRLDRRDLAAAATHEAERAAQIAPEVPSVQAAALRCRGLLEGDADRLTRAITLTAHSGRVLDHGGACEDAATVLAARERLPEARAALEQALALYRPLDASWLTARADAAYRSLGGRRGSRGPRSARRGGWDSLTRSELAVAQLIAEGLTNREIGVRLFISPHTVNSHLRSAFRKLEVSTRAALAARVTAERAHRTQLQVHSIE